MAEPIEMQFVLRTRVGPGNHVLDGVNIPQGKGPERRSAAHYAKTTKLIEMLFGMLSRVDRDKEPCITWGYCVQIPHVKG